MREEMGDKKVNIRWKERIARGTQDMKGHEYMILLTSW
jgi:hypothetical protein